MARVLPPISSTDALPLRSTDTPVCEAGRYEQALDKRRLPMEDLPDVPVITNAGFQGCAHARPGAKRQVLLVDRETLEAMNLQPGIIRENITTEGLNVNGLKNGEQLQIGDVRLEVSAVCTPRDQLEKVRPGLRKEIWGRRGMLCRVVSGGILRRGDAIERVSSAVSAC